MDTPPETGEIYSVSQLNREVRDLIEHGLPGLWVEGELSNVAHPASGHIYFTLKDSQAQVRCAMFRMHNRTLKFRPENGTQVLVHARAGLYETRGEYQLVVDQMEEAGDGALRRAFELLKQRLDTEGLFDTQHKQALPPLPVRIGVITSPTGAAIRDILSVLARRFPAIPVLIYPVAVQGEGAGEQIARALQRAAERAECDVLILARGGGSLEDLWAFNEEVVARAIHACPIPVVSGVGHEIDFTIADFAADQRAPTPSAAAELLSPDQNEWRATLQRQAGLLHAAIMARVRRQQQQLTWLTQRLQQQHPGRRLRERMQRLDELDQRLQLAWRALWRERSGRLGTLNARLHQHTPLHRLNALGTRRQHLQQRLHLAARRLLEQRRVQLAGTLRALDTVSPLSTLARGYAIVQTQEGQVVRAAGEVNTGDRVQTRLGSGQLICTVDETRDDNA